MARSCGAGTRNAIYATERRDLPSCVFVAGSTRLRSRDCAGGVHHRHRSRSGAPDRRIGSRCRLWRRSSRTGTRSDAWRSLRWGRSIRRSDATGRPPFLGSAERQRCPRGRRPSPICVLELRCGGLVMRAQALAGPASGAGGVRSGGAWGRLCRRCGNRRRRELGCSPTVRRLDSGSPRSASGLHAFRDAHRCRRRPPGGPGWRTHGRCWRGVAVGAFGRRAAVPRCTRPSRVEIAAR